MDCTGVCRYHPGPDCASGKITAKERGAAQAAQAEIIRKYLGRE